MLAEKLGVLVELAFRPAFKSFVFVIRAGFSPRGICCYDFFRGLLGRADRREGA